MSKFGYRAIEEFKYVNQDAVLKALSHQISQERKQLGLAEPLGEILVKRGNLTRDQLDTMLQTLLMEPNISWGEETRFAKSLNVEKGAKQAIGNYVGKYIAEQPEGRTVFMGGASTVYYAFRGMVKHKAHVNVQTIHAAILAAYPSFKSEIVSVSTVWKGRVNLDTALIEPADFDDTMIKNALNRGATHAIIPATGFDPLYGPMGTDSTARQVAAIVLESNMETCVLIDHTKIRIDTPKTEPTLLFELTDWRRILSRGHVKVVVNCHPDMPAEQAGWSPRDRQATDIRNELRKKGADPKLIQDVLRYYEWAVRVSDILKEVPFQRK